MYPTCRAAFVGMRNVITAGSPLKIPLDLASSSNEWDTMPPLQYVKEENESMQVQ